ncbi:MAG: hypothetical protein JEZ11_00850 [Desulfobacterales bacterium]|nr:hypothetical protein [Desulfobacterales bacterium]
MGFTIETMDGIMVVRFEPGTIFTYELASAALHRQRSRPESLTTNDIWDTRGCAAASAFNSEQVMQIVDNIKSLHSGGQYHEKTALVVDSEESFGVSRMFQILGEAFPYEIQIFTDVRSARRWIGVKK